MFINNMTNLTNMTSSSVNVVNFAQNVRLLANQSESGRMVPISSSATDTAAANNASAMIGVVIAIVVASVFVVLAIGTALFKARRHIASWRLTGKTSKLDENNDGANGALTQPSEDGSGEQPTEAAAATATAATITTTAPTDSVQTANEVNEQVTIDTTEVKCGSEAVCQESKDQQISPSSASPLINDDESANLVAKTVPASGENVELVSNEGGKGEQVTSSSSLIVNVLNELSESVVCKLAVDPEKQPLNE